MDKKEKFVYIMSAVVCVVVLVGKYCYSSYQDNKNSSKNEKEGVVTEKIIHPKSKDLTTQKQMITTQKSQNGLVEIEKPTIETENKKEVESRLSIGNPAPYGIEIGNATEKEIRTRFSIIKEIDEVRDNKKYKILVLDAKDFSSEELYVKEVDSILDQDGIVVRFRIVYSGKMFSQLHPNLSRKYKVTYSNIPFVGDKSAEYTSNNILIDLEEPHIGGFVTYLVYITKQFNKEIESYNKKNEQEKQKRIEDQL